MHISDGILSPGILISGAVFTVAGVAVGLKRIELDEIPAIGILSAVFFVASLVHVPVGPASVHLILNGLLGIMLGWKAFPSTLVGLTLQALLFQFGGITTLGVNTFNMAFPAVVCYYLFGRGVKPGSRRPIFMLSAFSSGFCAVLFASLLVGFSLYLTGEAFLPAAKMLVVAHLPVMFIEGILTTVCALFIVKVRPELLKGTYAQ